MNAGMSSDTNMSASKQSGGKRSKSVYGKNSRKHNKQPLQRGGYSQYMSNVANTPSYSTGGNLSASNSALASPVPFTPTNNCMNSWKHLGGTEPYNKIIS
jgi:hypothetical protein